MLNLYTETLLPEVQVQMSLTGPSSRSSLGGRLAGKVYAQFGTVPAVLVLISVVNPWRARSDRSRSVGRKRVSARWLRDIRALACSEGRFEPQHFAVRADSVRMFSSRSSYIVL
jgi:hypothetical protein